MGDETAAKDCESRVMVGHSVFRCERLAGHDGQHIRSRLGYDKATKEPVTVDVEWPGE